VADTARLAYLYRIVLKMIKEYVKKKEMLRIEISYVSVLCPPYIVAPLHHWKRGLIRFLV
jgi:hypothetical protein